MTEWFFCRSMAPWSPRQLPPARPPSLPALVPLGLERATGLTILPLLNRIKTSPARTLSLTLFATLLLLSSLHAVEGNGRISVSLKLHSHSRGQRDLPPSSSTADSPGPSRAKKRKKSDVFDEFLAGGRGDHGQKRRLLLGRQPKQAYLTTFADVGQRKNTIVISRVRDAVDKAAKSASESRKHKSKRKGSSRSTSASNRWALKTDSFWEGEKRRPKQLRIQIRLNKRSRDGAKNSRSATRGSARKGSTMVSGRYSASPRRKTAVTSLYSSGTPAASTLDAQERSSDRLSRGQLSQGRLLESQVVGGESPQGESSGSGLAQGQPLQSQASAVFETSQKESSGSGLPQGQPLQSQVSDSQILQPAVSDPEGQPSQGGVSESQVVGGGSVQGQWSGSGLSQDHSMGASEIQPLQGQLSDSRLSQGQLAQVHLTQGLLPLSRDHDIKRLIVSRDHEMADLPTVPRSRKVRGPAASLESEPAEDIGKVIRLGVNQDEDRISTGLGGVHPLGVGVGHHPPDPRARAAGLRHKGQVQGAAAISQYSPGASHQPPPGLESGRHYPASAMVAHHPAWVRGSNELGHQPFTVQHQKRLSRSGTRSMGRHKQAAKGDQGNVRRRTQTTVGDGGTNQLCDGNQTICDIFALNSPGYDTCCGRVCRNLQVDELHCGSCSLTCPAANQCCAGICKEIQSDVNNCGACFVQCSGGSLCVNGVCEQYGVPGRR